MAGGSGTSMFSLCEMASIGYAPFILAAPTIKSAKLNWKNYLCWFAFMELWVTCSGYHDHFETELYSISDENKS